MHAHHAHILVYGAAEEASATAPAAAAAGEGWSIAAASHLWATNCNGTVTGKFLSDNVDILCYACIYLIQLDTEIEFNVSHSFQDSRLSAWDISQRESWRRSVHYVYEAA